MDACTIAARNYLAQARVLATSFHEHHPGGRFVTLVVDGDGEPTEDGREPFEIVTPSDLPLERDEFLRMAASYDVLELSTALKPWFLRRLLSETGRPVVYFDPDIQIFDSLEDIGELVAEHDIVLTPHVTRPMPRDELLPTEQSVLFAGMYNLGFIAMSTRVAHFLDWWEERLARDCLFRPEAGIFVDQRWVDFVPSLFSPYIFRDEACNVAHWNLSSRSVTHSSEGFLVNGRPLRFFHFSGFDPERPYLLSKHQGPEPRILLSEEPDLARLHREYASRLAESGYETSSQQRYRLDFAPNGMRLDRRMRRLYRSALLDAERDGSPEPPNPFSTPQRFVEWLREPFDQRGQAAGVSRYLRAVWEERADIQREFNDLRWIHGDRYVEWIANGGVVTPPIPAQLFPEQPEAPRALSDKSASLVPGVNILGYLRAEAGVGEAARQITSAVRQADIAHVALTYDHTPSRQEHPFESQDERLPIYDVNLICVNADALPSFAYDAGPTFFEGRYSIGVWWWEVAEFPQWMHGAFDIVDEIWVGSDHIANAIATETRKPVRVFPLPVRVPEMPRLSGDERPFPRDRFVYLFAFDFLSVFERKNPLGLIEAFSRAFEPGEGPLLVIKSINGDRQLPVLEALRAAAAERSDIELRDGYVSAAEMRLMMASCDAYVSLHRSEGFGLTIAEAMAYGRPVIATGYSGNLTFMSDENSFLVPHELTAIPEMCGPYPAGAEWAEPDLDAAAALLRQVYEQPEEARQRAERGREALRDRHSFEKAGEFVSARLDEIRASRAAAPPSALPTTATAATQEAVRYLTEGPSVPIRAPSRFGSIGVFGRRLVYRLLRPYIVRQREFEHSVVRALAEVEDIAHRRSRAVAQTAREAVKTAQQALDRTDRERARELELDSWFEKREDRLANAETGVAEARFAAQSLDARLYARPYVADPQQLMTVDDAGRPAMGYRDGSRNGPLYLGFEEIFRGSEEFIRERQRSYVDLLSSHAPVLDVGSGRGELLELLREAGIKAKGIDLDPAMVERAREKGAEVEEAEAVEYLESQPPQSLGAIAAIQVIEHLPYEKLVRFFELTRERLVPGGVLLLETVNPHAFEAFKAFWVDPTHRSPIFPEVAVALCQLNGFESALVTFPNGSGDLERDRREQGEYAVVATKQR